jgi:hypothetical protein
MDEVLINILRTLNQLLTAGIAITALSLLFYALTFNLRDRVARSFALILLCVVIVYVAEAIGSSTGDPTQMEFWLRLQWIGIIILPPAYVHFSDALLATTGRPSRGRRRRMVALSYLIAFIFLLTLPFGLIVGPLVDDLGPAPHLRRTTLTFIFTLFYLVVMTWAWVNLWRAYQRTVTSAGKRRMRYLLAGALAPALGSFPYLLFGSGFAYQNPLLFWLGALLSNIFVTILLVVMAYAVAFFGVAWPDRVIKRRLFKWLMRGPFTASTALAITTLAKRAGESFKLEYQAVVPILMVAIILIMEHSITLIAPLWERWSLGSSDRTDIDLLQTLEERLLTTSDLREFLESVLTAICDRLQVSNTFIVVLGHENFEMLVTIGNDHPFDEEDNSEDLIKIVTQNGDTGTKQSDRQLFIWGDYWIVPLNENTSENNRLLGFLGTYRDSNNLPDGEQIEALMVLASRASMALEDRYMQQKVFTSLESLTPQVDFIQRLRAASRYEDSEVLTSPYIALEHDNLPKWVKDALSHYWGGPKLAKNPLMDLQIVQRALKYHEGNYTNALRSILRQAIERVRPDGDRRFTAEWILYNILELKFLEGRKVREIAMRLSVSEADLYRKQRVAIEAVANAIVEMERQAREEQFQQEETMIT